MSTRSHVLGQSEFVDDIPFMSNELHVGYVGSPVAHGELLSIDASEALQVQGIVAVLTAKDLHKKNWGTIVQDQPLLVDKVISHKDEPICLLASESRAALEHARKLVKFKIKSLPAILSLDEAIKKKSYLHAPTPFQCGDVESALKNSPHRHHGVFRIGGQEHFYLESQASIAYPQDGDFIKVISSSQHPTETQHVVAHALGLPFHSVTCEVKRMGGAFGGKESQAAPFAAMAALMAFKLKRPCRMVLTKDDDMKVTGKRHPFQTHFDVGFDDNGKILGLKLKLFADGGAYTDLSPSILDRAMFHSDGCYYLENALIEGWVCKTHTHSNTAFRGFGGPQGALLIESLFEDIAEYLRKLGREKNAAGLGREKNAAGLGREIDAAEIRVANLYGKTERNETPYRQKVENNLLPDLFQNLLKSSDYKKRRKEIDLYNAKSIAMVRGLAITGCKFGISFTTRFLNQGNALVHIHRDGTVQVSTGATDMGQGVNTKIQIVAARAFGIATEDVQVTVTSTEKNANTSPTAASSGSDINGMATLVACGKILNRLRQVALKSLIGDKNPLNEIELDAAITEKDLHELESRIQFEKNQVKDTRTGKGMPWRELVNLAYLNRISISDYGHMKTEGLAFDRAKGKGRAFKYFTPGAAVSEVSVDTYTGEVKILRTDILMDLGRPIHHGIDRGQVTGGFIQGAGWMLTENLFYSEDGGLVSHSPTTYKIPNIQDVPREFNVGFLENDLNEGTVLKSKAVGEPPLLLSASVFAAVKDALRHRSKSSYVDLRVPATPEEVLKKLSPHEL
jgi:xanthine dehydrogenase large subunit